MGKSLLIVILIALLISCKHQNPSSNSILRLEHLSVKDSILEAYYLGNYNKVLFWDSAYMMNSDNDSLLLQIRIESSISGNKIDYAGNLLNKNKIKIDKEYYLYYKSRIENAKSNSAKALIYIDSAIAINKLSDILYLQRYDIYSTLNNEALAMADLRTALSLKGKNVWDAFGKMALLYMQQEKYDSASIYYRFALANDRHYVVFFNYGLCKYYQNDLDSALILLDYANSLNPQDTRIYLDKGRIYYHTNKKDLACDSWRKALLLNDTIANSLLDQYCQ